MPALQTGYNRNIREQAGDEPNVKSIVEKLGLQKYKHAAILNQPDGTDYFPDLTGYDTVLKDGPYDLIFAFVLNLESLKELVYRIIEQNLLQPNGYLFAAYPKKGNKTYPTYIHRDDLFPGLGSDEEGYIGDSGIKFARMVGLDEVFTVVGFKRDAKGKAKEQTSSQPSQRVDDYIAMIGKGFGRYAGAARVLPNADRRLPQRLGAVCVQCQTRGNPSQTPGRNENDSAGRLQKPRSLPQGPSVTRANTRILHPLGMGVLFLWAF